MPRIKLAHWYGDKAPGDEIDVDDVQLKALRRDGMVAEVVGESGDALQPGSTEATNATAEPEPVLTKEQWQDAGGETPPQGRKRR
ncbi:hypothetical protein TR631_12340 [Streptomyces rochei]|uniref:hypothetical protein n=1 Tax=Streptomyces rochei TaxID=1928 RepID=UPI002ACD9667|nr:hypothetical protein [Streptomyces rochei]WQC12556.1 hypothetical protein TR631_12340 [Streptomyces rochei]